MHTFGWCPVCQVVVYECETCTALLHGEVERDAHLCQRRKALVNLIEESEELGLYDR